jgi:hypothetical protein
MQPIGAGRVLAAACFGACVAACTSPQSKGDAPTPTPGPAGPSVGAAVSPSSPVGAAETPSDVPAPEPSPAWIRGTLQSRFIQRWTADDSDLDLYEVLALDFGDEQNDAWTGHTTARLAWDLDGPSSLYGSLEDTEDGPVDVQLYDAYAETHDRGAWSDIRLGRQFLYDTPAVMWFDGAFAQTKEYGGPRWTTGVYGGATVHEWESAHSGDWVGGLFGEVHATKWTKLRADWLHVEDETLLAAHQNDLLGLALFHDEGGRLRWDARYSRLEDNDRDASVGATWFDVDRGFTFQATHYRLLQAQQSLALELDPFFNQLLTLYPYDETRLNATKSIGAHVQLLGGIDYRHVADSADQGPYNHDFDREFLTTTFDKLLPGELTVSLTGEVWNGDDSDIQTWGADLSRQWKTSSKRLVEVNLGSFYSLFKFDPFAGSESENVRTYYTSLRYRMSDTHTLLLRYEHEDQDIGNFDSLRWGWSWRF